MFLPLDRSEALGLRSIAAGNSKHSCSRVGRLPILSLFKYLLRVQLLLAACKALQGVKA